MIEQFNYKQKTKELNVIIRELREFTIEGKIMNAWERDMEMVLFGASACVMFMHSKGGQCDSTATFEGLLKKIS